MAFGPLVYREDQGWDTNLHVQNLSATTNAKVKVTFLDHSGNPLTTVVDWVCPRGNQTFALRAIGGWRDAWPLARVGQVRVESQRWWSPGDPAVQAPFVQAVAELVRYAGPGSNTPLEALGYTLFSEAQAFDWQTGVAGDVGLIGVPSLYRRSASAFASSSELAIQNVNPNPGVTDFALLLYDQNGLLDFVCQKLDAGQSLYINLDSWQYVNPGFKGSAVISGTRTTQGGFGLTAVTVTRARAILGVDMPGDESAGFEGFPIPGPFTVLGPAAPQCPG